MQGRAGLGEPWANAASVALRYRQRCCCTPSINTPGGRLAHDRCCRPHRTLTGFNQRPYACEPRRTQRPRAGKCPGVQFPSWSASLHSVSARAGGPFPSCTVPEIPRFCIGIPCGLAFNALLSLRQPRLTPVCTRHTSHPLNEGTRGSCPVPPSLGRAKWVASGCIGTKGQGLTLPEHR